MDHGGIELKTSKLIDLSRSTTIQQVLGTSPITILAAVCAITKEGGGGQRSHTFTRHEFPAAM